VIVFLASVSVALAVPSVPPPQQPGPWRQTGVTVTSKTGKVGHFFRLVKSPTALAVVARSTSSRPIRLTWFSYCEFQSDDEMTQENQAVVTGVHTVSAYPPVLSGATLCQVSVTMRVVGGRAAAAVFSY
jgi:hypothetical protein